MIYFLLSLVNINNREEEANFNERGNPDNLISRERSISAPNVHKIGLPDGEVIMSAIC
jgi:hypothetical protein